VIDGDSGLIRIGELSSRTGVSVDLLRAWERRYGLLSPQRTAGGFRLYTEADQERVARMTARLAAGFPASVAAQLALSPSGAEGAVGEMPSPEDLLRDLAAALAAFDEAGANTALDRAFAGYSLETVLGEVVMPYLQELGRLWTCGEISIAQEHYASSIIRGRLLGFARGWGSGRGPVALLACPPGELHDLGLIAFGLVLRAQGWRILMLGPNTPIASLSDAADDLAPAVVVIASMQPALIEAMDGDIASLAGRHPVALAGPGATATAAAVTGASLIEGSPIAGARAVAAAFGRGAVDGRAPATPRGAAG
jgi:DNA-binding transcriptional MerR regulator